MTTSGGGVKKQPLDNCEYHLTTTPEVILLNNDGVTFTKIANMVLNGGRNFSVTTGTLKYLNGATVFLVNGTSDIEVDKAADVTYALVINGTPVPTELTTIGFTSAGKKRNISITARALISLNDEVEIHAKGDGTANVTLTVNKLDVTFLEIP